MQIGLSQCCQHMQLYGAITLNEPSCVYVQTVQTCYAHDSTAVKEPGEGTTNLQ
jgi:hypothetical protein